MGIIRYPTQLVGLDNSTVAAWEQRREAQVNIVHHPTELVGLKNPIAAAVLEALYSFDPIRSSFSLIDVRESNGMVELRGCVATRMIKAMATDLALSVPGVRDVDNRLIADSDIDVAVAEAIACDNRTHLTSTQVASRSTQSIVRLAGWVPSAEVKMAVEEVVRGVLGVRDVVNDLEIRS
jgi:osmotically-inducible protein OsmY